MKVYLDLVFFLNFAFDCLLLLSTTIILRRNIRYNRIIRGGLVGGLSIFVLFLKINSFTLFLIKIFISILMILVTFGFKNIKYTLKNLFYLYTASMILGGFLYFLNVQFSYKQEGLVFYHNGLSINFVFLIIFSPLIIYTYVKQSLKLKNNYSLYYKVDIYKEDKIYHFNGYLDTGNNLIDPYFKKPVIVVSNKKLFKEKYFYTPTSTINQDSLMKCIKVEKIKINNDVIKNVIVGDGDIKLEGIDCILNNKIMEEIK